jgi:integrase/recombinase XerD
VEYFTQDELLRLLAAAKAVRERDWLMILVAFWHGLRASEVTGLTPDNVRDGRLRVKRLKGRKKPITTTHPLVRHPEPLLDERDALIDFAAKSTPRRPIFGVRRKQFYNLVRKYGAIAGLPRDKCHPHALKHSIATQTIDAVGIHRMQRYLGHKSISSTGIYLNVTDQQASDAVADALGAGRPAQGRLII